MYHIETPIKKLKATVRKALSVEQQDKYMDEVKSLNVRNSAVETKKYYDTIEYSAENMEKALFILSRVYRNSSIKDDTFNEKVLDFILNAACYLGFQIIDELNNTKESAFQNLTSDEVQVLMKVITNFMPLVIETRLFDALAQNNLERIFQEKIAELKPNSKKNQFKLMLLYYWLIDLDVKGNKKYILEAIELINMPILRYTTILKLYTYLMFKTNDNLSLETFIKEAIQLQELKINPKIDKSNLQKSLNQKTKILMVNREKNKKSKKRKY